MIAAVTMSLPDWLVLVAYFVVIVVVGMWFGKFTRSTDDFFFAGRRFSWWLVAITPGDLLHVGDVRWWLGGFRSLSLTCGEPTDEGDAALLSTAAVDRGHLRPDRAVRVEKIL